MPMANTAAWLQLSIGIAGGNVSNALNKLSSGYLGEKRRQLCELRDALRGPGASHHEERKGLERDAQGTALEYEEDAQRLALLELEGDLASHDADRLAQVERALEKIDDGTYGVSDAGHGAISIARLDAVPEAMHTLAEQRARERNIRKR